MRALGIFRDIVVEFVPFGAIGKKDVRLRFGLEVGVQSSYSDTYDLGRPGTAADDGRSAVAAEDPVDAGRGLEIAQAFRTRYQPKLGRVDLGPCQEGRSVRFAAPGTVTKADGSQLSGDFVANRSAQTAAPMHRYSPF